MIEVRIGKRGYEIDEAGQPIVKAGKYPEGDCRRIGPPYVRFQRSSRAREERRGRATEQAQKAGFKTFGQLLFAQRATGGERAPKKPGRTRALKRDARRAGVEGV